ncbi:Hypp6490 [Branchiostoma lanceolatum]|uniref:Hypp6490 protein n=1 Tax=Branchiostoma lanceolatum TaxID=7740 RepID=A0A8J9YUX7_BRALA|nr:Hypp6490 [Branchiostoma lanceolatum]
MFEDLIGLIEQLPDKAFKLRNAVENALRTLGQFNSEDWPEPAQPIIQMVMGVIDTYHQIKSDILGFYNAVNMGIKVDLPWAAEQIWGSITTMIEALNDVFSNPKGALSDMFKSAFRLIQAVTKLIERKNEIMGYVYPNGDWPYWFDLSGLATEVMDNITTALEASEAIGQAWVAEITQDPVKHVLGKSESELKRYMMSQLGDVLNSLREPIAPLLTLVSEVQEMFTLVEDTINSVKEGYALLFEMYSKVKAIQERLFGPKAHLKFPRKIRLSGNGCGEDGFYPTDNRGKYEGRMGVDLDADIGNLIVSPFSGNMWKLNDKAVGINCTESSMNGMTAYVENVDLDSTVFKNAEQVSVLAGDEIGKAARSSCSNHIHFSVEKDNIFVDISKFLEPRFINLPQWIQHCDDYKLVYKFQTIKAGYIVGLGGQKNEDTSPERTVTEPDTSNLQMPEKTKRKKRGISISVSSNGEDLLTTLGIPAIDSSGPAGGGFSMTKLKICNILDFLQAVGMDDTREALIKVIESVQALIESKPCSRPETKTDDRLRAELELRGSETTGSREQLITRMKQVDQGCPFLTLSLPDNVYCTVDDLCLGVSCCVDLQVWKFRKSIKAYARFDIEEFTFKMGIETAGLDPWTYEYKAADGIWDVEMELDTGISFGFVGVDMDLRLRFVLEYEKPTHFFLTLRVGLCGEECLEFFTLLNHALLPIPEKLPNGTWVWPDIDWESQLQNVVTQSMRHIGQQALAWLGLPAAVNMGIKVDLPWAAEQIWGSITTMIEALNDVFSNPKGALSDMFKSAFRLIQAVTKLIERKNEIMGYVYPNGDWPYWFDLSGLATEVMDNVTTALEASEAIGQAWVAEITQDPVKHVLGKSESELKRYMMSQLGDVLNSLREPIAPLLTLVSEVQEMFTLVEDTINSVKEGYALLFEMYSKIVSPFSGNMWKLNDKAVGINCTESSMNGMTAYVENVDLDSTVFKNAEQVSVLAGDEIGKAARSSCSNHIHFSVEKDNIFVDISKFLEPRFINLPQWIQHCDDYKLVYKTIKAGYIVGLGGQKNEDTSPERTVTEPDTSNLQMPEKTKRKKRGISISVSSNGEDLLTTLGIPAIDSSGPAGDVEMELDTGISFGFVGVDMDLRLRFVLEYEKPTHFFLTLRVGLCGEECLQFFTLLNHALLPIPEKLPNGTWVWPDIDWESQLQNVVTQSMRHIGQQALAWLGLPADVLDNTEPCPFPRRLTDAQLVSRLQKQGLSTTGDSATLLARYEAADRSINCCVEVSIPSLDFTKAFRAFVKLDVCEFEIMAGFETLEYRKLIFNYPWGGRQEIKLSEGINILLTIDRDADHLNFIIDLGLKACHDGDCFLEVDIFDDLVLPIPICNANASLTVPSIDDFVDKLAGEVSQTAVDIILKQLGLQQVFLPVREVAQLPANSNGSSGGSIDGYLDYLEEQGQSALVTVTDAAVDVLLEKLGLSDVISTDGEPCYRPIVLQNGWAEIDKCNQLNPPQLPDTMACTVIDSCMGVECCLDLDFKLIKLTVQSNVHLDLCSYKLLMSIGNVDFEQTLFTYEWGTYMLKHFDLKKFVF